MVCKSVVSWSHAVTRSPILEGRFWYSPKFCSNTTSTLPASWPGRKLVIRTGRPTAAASAIVPGPALDTKTSAATMYSGMLVRNPSGRIATLPLVGAVASAAAAAFRASMRCFRRTLRSSPRTPPVRFRAPAAMAAASASKSLVSNSFRSFSLRPQTTQTVASTPLPLSSAYRWLTMSLRDPTPSPPPMTRTTCRSGLAMPSSLRICCW
mmetsp:Transcript_21308/g.46527  ORF Transcript_21308/g.46527 Transcript_21308/m.46527 type:complete len:209 (+) Transcript_21308:348-974(+)